MTAVQGTLSDHTIELDGTCSEQGNELVAQGKTAHSLRTLDI